MTSPAGDESPELPQSPEPADEMELDDEVGSGLLRSFGRQVKAFRDRAGMSQVELGGHLGCSQSQVASVEIGRRVMQPAAIDKADDVLEAHGVLKAMKEEVARAAFPRLFRDATRFEARAEEIHAYDTHTVNALLRTEPYLRAVLAARRPLLSENAIEAGVTACLERQKLFTRSPAPVTSFVMDEAVLRRPFGNGQILRDQLEHLLLMGRTRTVELQVMPLDREDNAGCEGPFTLLETGQQTTIAHVEVQGVSRLHTQRRRVRELEVKYGLIRAQALAPFESLQFIEELLTA